MLTCKGATQNGSNPNEINRREIHFLFNSREKKLENCVLFKIVANSPKC